MNDRLNDFVPRFTRLISFHLPPVSLLEGRVSSFPHLKSLKVKFKDLLALRKECIKERDLVVKEIDKELEYLQSFSKETTELSCVLGGRITLAEYVALVVRFLSNTREYLVGAVSASNTDSSYTACPGAEFSFDEEEDLDKYEPNPLCRALVVMTDVTDLAEGRIPTSFGRELDEVINRIDKAAEERAVLKRERERRRVEDERQQALNYAAERQDRLAQLNVMFPD